MNKCGSYIYLLGVLNDSSIFILLVVGCCLAVLRFVGAGCHGLACCGLQREGTDTCGALTPVEVGSRGGDADGVSAERHLR